MVALAGEEARRTGKFRCTGCHQTVSVTKGRQIPKCPNCGHDIYEEQDDDRNQ